MAAGTRGALGAGLVVLGGLGLLVGLELATYHRLTYEQPVATIQIEGLGGRDYAATVRLEGVAEAAEERVFRLAGDEWRLDARVIKWHGWANLLGLDARYRLDRIGGRFAHVDEARDTPPAVYALSESGRLDLWSLARRNPRWLPMLDAQFGSSVYMPMVPGGHYRVHLTQSGLVARPSNAVARDRVRNWR